MNLTKKMLVSFSVVAAIALTSNASTGAEPKKIEVSKAKSILQAYSDIALTNYSDALKDAKALKTAIDTFAKAPTQAN
mgnify:CR=1 FL=1